MARRAHAPVRGGPLFSAAPAAHHTETPVEASRRRALLRGSVDFTMMYVAHDAFNRDVARLVDAAGRGRGFTPAAVATWRSFRHQLHTHHTAEDAALWPRLHEVVSGDEAGILTSMEAEHAAIDPRLERIDAALGDRNGTILLAELQTLGDELAEHMKHEEQSALPLLDRRLGAAGWEAFNRQDPGTGSPSMSCSATHFVRDLHRRLYGDIWTWAGVYRKRELNIGIAPEHIAVELHSSLETIRYRWRNTHDWSPREVGIVAHAETVRIHPFTDGNGRATRLLADLVFVAAQHGETLEQYDWELDPSTSPCCASMTRIATPATSLSSSRYDPSASSDAEGATVSHRVADPSSDCDESVLMRR